MFFLDVAWARYTASVALQKRTEASFMASFIILLTGTVTISYTTDMWMLIPAALGAFVGTYVTVRKRDDSVNS